jgi:hypothetical protein
VAVVVMVEDLVAVVVVAMDIWYHHYPIQYFLKESSVHINRTGRGRRNK